LGKKGERSWTEASDAHVAVSPSTFKEKGAWGAGRTRRGPIYRLYFLTRHVDSE
jgi:hypothetical protein